MPSIQAHNNLDKAAFEQLFKSHFVHLCNFASQYVSDMDAARDICQKVFILLWENRESIKTDQNVRSYLFTSVKNRSLNYIRDQKKYRSHVLDIDIQDVDLAFEEDQLAVEDLKIKIEKALNALPEKCQLVFEMSRYEVSRNSRCLRYLKENGRSAYVAGTQKFTKRFGRLFTFAGTRYVIYRLIKVEWTQGMTRLRCI
jgi:RNA polymerase sigma-70 factor (ECF subfamily)